MGLKSKLKNKKPVTRKVLIPMDDEQAKQLADGAELVSRARLMGDPAVLAEANSKLADLRAQLVEAGAITMAFRGIGRPAYEALRLAHAPTEDQRAKAEADKTPISWNPDTFPAALCAAAAVDSDMTEAEWLADVFESPDWGPGELAVLFNAAIEANQDRRVEQLGN